MRYIIFFLIVILGLAFSVEGILKKSEPYNFKKVLTALQRAIWPLFGYYGVLDDI